LEIRADENPDVTKALLASYSARCQEHSGFAITLTDPAELVQFTRAAAEIAKVGVTAEDWMEAQFAQLAFTGSRPYPTQIAGEKAMNRFATHRYEMNSGDSDGPVSEEDRQWKEYLRKQKENER